MKAKIKMITHKQKVRGREKEREEKSRIIKLDKVFCSKILCEVIKL